MTLLALARKVYPDCEWIVFVGGGVIRRNAPLVSCEDLPFDPERNPAQLLDVLCWLLNSGLVRIDEGTPVLFDIKAGKDCVKVDDNTPQSLAAAIVKAAVRVAGEEA